MSIKAITNWSILISFVAFLIGWIGGMATVKDYESDKFDIYSGIFYIAFIAFILAIFVRFIIFLITRG